MSQKSKSRAGLNRNESSDDECMEVIRGNEDEDVDAIIKRIEREFISNRDRLKTKNRSSIARAVEDNPKQVTSRTFDDQMDGQLA